MLVGNSLTVEERDWVTAGLAWVGLRRWMCGSADGERARLWFEAQIAARFTPSCHGWLGPGPRPLVRSVTADMERLLCEMQAGLGLPPELTYHA